MNSYRVKAAVSRSILANPDACFVMMMALPFGSTRAFATAMRRLGDGCTLIRSATRQVTACSGE